MRDTHTGRRTPARGLEALLLVCGLLVLSAGAVWTSPADASQPPHPVYFSQGVTIPNDGTTLNGPQQLAVNASDHTLLVANQGAGDVGVFSSSVDPGTGTTVMTAQPSIGAGVLSAPYGLAVDQALRRLYVSDPGLNVIRRYTFTTATPAVYTADPTFTSPTLGAGAGQVGNFAAMLAVDPTTHNLLVADQSNHRVSRFSGTGAFVSSLDGSSGPDGTFFGPSSVAVDPGGTVYVTDAAAFNAATGHVERFSTNGSSLGDLEGAQTPTAIGAGATLGTVMVGSLNAGALINGGPDFGSYLHGYIGVDPTQTLTGTPGFDTTFLPFDVPLGIAVDDSPGGNLYVDANASGTPSGVFVLTSDSVLAPGVSIGATSALTATGAHVTGTIDSGGAPETASTSAHFAYYTADPTQLTALPDLPAGTSGAHAVTVDFTGLRPNTTYHVLLTAARLDDTLTDPVDPSRPLAHTDSRTLTFTTAGAAPAITEPPIRDFGSTTATLAGTVDPFGLQGSYHFEYGTTDAYGSRLPATVDGVLGAPAAPKGVSAVLTGLAPGTTYHYRLVGTNSVGTTYGADQQFTTAPAPSAATQRSYEQLTPVDKGGALLDPRAEFFSLSLTGSTSDGSMLSYVTNGAFPGAAIGTGVFATYRAVRGAAGWTHQLLDVPSNVAPTSPVKNSTTLSGGFLTQHPADLAHSIVYSDRVLAPGAQEGLANVYRQDNDTGALHLLGTFPDPNELTQFEIAAVQIWATPDSAHVYAIVNYELYELGGGHVTLVSVLPDGSTPLDATAPSLSVSSAITAFTPISTPSGDAITYASPNQGAFLNRAGHVTPISTSERPGDPATNVPVGAAGFSEDGSSVFFTEAGTDPLSGDAGTDAGAPLYRYKLDAPAGHHLSYVGGFGAAPLAVNPVLRISADGNTVVFDNPAGLTVWRDGPSGPTRRVLSTLVGDGSSPITPNPSLSRNGRYFAVDRARELTPDPTLNNAACGGPQDGRIRDGHCMAVYLFDLDANPMTVVCASCAADGSAPAGDARLGPAADLSVTDDGEVFFDTPSKLVSADANGDVDVYGYKAGRVQMVSRGTSGTFASFAGTTSSGSDVFLVSNDQLVGQDTDNVTDLYDARIGGGIPGQGAVPDETAPCAATECHEPGGGVGATSGPAAPSESVLAASQPGSVPVRARASLSKAVVGATTVRLSVRVSSRGDLRISGHYLMTSKRSVAAAGTYTISVRLTRAAQRLHLRHRRLKIGIRASLTPPFGAAAVATTTRTLRG